MSNNTNINTLSSIIYSLSNIVIKEKELEKANALTAALHELQAVRDNMISEREKRIKTDTQAFRYSYFGF
jgi:hypothetical protein